MDKDIYREIGTLFKRSPLVSPTGEGFAAKVRAVVADHARQLQGMMSQAKQSKGRFTQGMAGKKRTMLPGGILVETWINPFGLAPTLISSVYAPNVEGLLELEFQCVLESGGYVYSGLISPPSYATWYIGDPIKEQYTPTFDFTGDGQITVADTVCPIGTIKFLADGEDAEMPVPFIGTVNPVTYVTGQSLNERTDAIHLTQWLCPPSIYTGKLRLYIQAIYGSPREDYSSMLSASGNLITLYLNTDGENDPCPISVNGRQGSILITLPGYEYYICQINATDTCELSFFVLEPTVGSSEICSLLKSELLARYPGQENSALDTQKNILETLLLSQLCPSPTTLTASCSLPAWAADYGEPLEYSWKATWDGLESSIVLVTGDATTYGIIGQRIKLSINYDEQFTAICEEVQNVTGSTIQDQHVWFPENIHVGSTSYLSDIFYSCGGDGETIIPSPPEAFSNLPVYGWYNEVNEWVGVSLGRDTESTAGFPTVGGNMHVCGYGTTDGSFVYVGDGNFRQNIVQCGDDTLTASSTKQTVTFYNRRAQITYQADQEAHSLLEDYTSGETESCSGDGIFSLTGITPPGGIIYIKFSVGYFSSYYNRQSGLSTAGYPAIIIPARDCEAVFYGTFRTGSSNYRYVLRRETNVYPLRLQHEVEVYEVAQSILQGDGTRTKGDTIWSGGQTREYYTLVDHWASTDVESTLVPAPSKALTIKFHGKSNYQTVYSGATSDAGNTYIGIALPPGDDIILPGTPVDSSYQSDWEAFFEAPFGVCVAGARTINLLPWVTQSAVFESLAAYGWGGIQLNMNTDSYPWVDSFVGWA